MAEPKFTTYEDALADLIAKRDLYIGDKKDDYAVVEITPQTPPFRGNLEMFNNYSYLKSLIINGTFHLMVDRELFIKYGYILLKDKEIDPKTRFGITDLYFQVKGTNNFIQFFWTERELGMYSAEQREVFESTISRRKSLIEKLKSIYPDLSEELRYATNLKVNDRRLFPIALFFSKILIDVDISPMILFT